MISLTHFPFTYNIPPEHSTIRQTPKNGSYIWSAMHDSCLGINTDGEESSWYVISAPSLKLMRTEKEGGTCKKSIISIPVMLV